MQQRMTQRVGLLYPDSSEALYKHRAAAIELCRPENCGPPACMTTTVGNTHTGAIVAFVKGGPFALPNPEHTFAHLTQQRVLDGVTTESNLNSNAK